MSADNSAQPQPQSQPQQSQGQDQLYPQQSTQAQGQPQPQRPAPRLSEMRDNSLRDTAIFNNESPSRREGSN